MTPHRCPVCAGCGWVQFNPDMPFVTTTTAGPWSCRPCGGTGVLWAPPPTAAYVPSVFGPAQPSGEITFTVGEYREDDGLTSSATVTVLDGGACCSGCDRVISGFTFTSGPQWCSAECASTNTVTLEQANAWPHTGFDGLGNVVSHNPGSG